jgi:pyruvate dehydrogenase E2 component (dihydrolipoamide acetyltransferase)
MGILVKMPRYGANMEEGTVGRWLAAEGDEVAAGQIICEIEIEKLTNDFEAPEDGVLRKILCDEGDARPCGDPIAVIAAADEDISALLAEAEGAGEARPAFEKEAAGGTASRAAAGSGMSITPKALKLAEEKGVDYSGIRGTGIHGAVTRQDIKDFIAAGGTAAAAGGSVPMSAARRVTAEYMMRSLSKSAQATIAVDADVTDLVGRYRLKKPEYEEKNIKLSYTAVLVKAIAAALVDHPVIRTAAEEGSTLRTAEEINIGIGVDAEYGLVVPVIRHADRKELPELCTELQRLGDKARSGDLRPEDMKGGVVSLSNLGMFGVRYSTPILNPGESAIVGAGTLTQQPVILDGGIHTRWIISLSMTFDHRVIDGAPAARFLQSLVKHMNGEEIW